MLRMKKTVYVPLDIVKESGGYASYLDTDSEKTLFEVSGWRVTASKHYGTLYVCYIKLNQSGEPFW